MSCFAGKLIEYPSFSVDCFDKSNLDVHVYFLSHCHQDHMKGMDSAAFYQRLSLSSNTFVYCSETSRNILLCDDRYKHLEKFLVGLPIEHSTMIAFNNHKTGESETVSVTLLSAGHCIGSVMFLFEGSAGTVLYTGDFRWSTGDASRMALFHSGESIINVKSIYIDTTFYLPQMKQIPSRESTKNAMVKLVERWLSKGCSYYVSLLCKGMYGYEYLLKEIAVALNTKIHVSSERMALYKNLPNMARHFTIDKDCTRIHSCNWQHERSSNSRLPCGFSLPAPQKLNVLKIKASSMWFARRTEPLPSDCVVKLKDDFYRVVHSMHASMEEIIDLVRYLRPLNVFPTVEPAGLYTIKQTQESLQQYARGKIEAKESVDTAECDDEETTPVKEQKSTSMFSNICVSYSAPSEEVLAECKHLGLEEEVLIKKPRRRRRNQISIENCVVDKIKHSEVSNGVTESEDRKKRRIVDHFEDK